MRRFLGWSCVIALAVLALSFVNADATCVLNCNARCIGPNTVAVNWELICTGSACSILGTTVSIGCFPDGPWTVIAKNIKPPYIDHPNLPCPGVNVYYKIDMDYECSGAEYHASCVTNGVRCP